MKKINIVLIGNPNVGKSTLFNRLTGGAQKIGNWPGKTVEIKEGTYKKGKLIANIVDLPGIYSLSPNSSEEVVANKYLEQKNPDTIIHIVDSTNLQRNLYLTTQLLEKNLNVILALNFTDIAKSKKILIDEKKLSAAFKVPVIKISAKSGDGLDNLLQTAISASKNRVKTAKTIKQTPKQRYSLISNIAKQAVHMPSSVGRKTEKIDRILTHKFLALPIFIAIMFVVFQLTFTMAAPFMDALDLFFSSLSEISLQIVQQLALPDWLGSLVSDGIISGIGGILIFLPNILILFLLFSVLEDTGYFARIALITDSLMQKVGLEGKAFIPLILGFGCNVPAIMATRIIEDDEERLISILINPLMSCSARLPIYILFVGVFFVQHQGLVLLSIYLLGIIVALMMALILRKLLLKSKSPPSLLIELPPYRMPTISTILKNTVEKATIFVKKAGYIILIISIFIWFLASIPFGVEYASKDSLIGQIGQLIAPVFTPAGFGNWQSSVALIFGSMAKEVVVSTFATLYGAEGEELNAIIAKEFTPLSALSFMVFSLIYMPCIAAIATIKKETGSTKWTLFAIIYTLILAWILSVAVFQIGSFLGF